MQLPEWIHEVTAVLPSPFTGKIELNCVEDGVAGMNATLYFKPPKKVLDKHQRIIVAIRQEPR